uniref:Transient receptor potential cation channel subfamily V member 6 n=1 Tax=Magallana gigas TaxID=29159 RepID=A0A8W8KLD8_MAGGI|nr:uncharacterized protein LOC117680422 isoform X2 [Crassostrea gigas]
MEGLYYIKKYEDDLEKDQEENVESSTMGVESREIEQDRLEHIKTSTKELINTNNSEKVLFELGKDIINADIISAKARLEALKDRKKPDWLKMYQSPDKQGETLLHLAIKSLDDIALVTNLSEMCPDLLLMSREQSPIFHGQTALHMAITKSNKEAIQEMLRVGIRYKKKEMSTLLHIRATGSRFVNTVMMGQLPLTVAALTGNTDIVDVLLEFGADLNIQNEEEDTVLHSLVKYAATYPEKVITIIQMMQHINQKLENKHRIDSSTFDHFGNDMHRKANSFLWLVKNKESLTPLQLSAKHGVTELFEEILNLKNVYCYISANDGLFDVKEYDITEIDTVSVINLAQSHKQSKSIPENFDGIARNIVQSNQTNCAFCWSYPETESILEMLFNSDYDSKDAYRIIELPPVQNIIKMKWNRYNKCFISWMILHYVSMILLTMYSVYNVELRIPSVQAGMYIVFRGTDEEDFSSYGRTMMAMFKLGIGIDDIGVLYSARIPWVAISIFTVFTTFTYILMLNALIAMMSQTCSRVSEERFPQWRIQQLSIILVIEDLICRCCFKNIRSAGTKRKVCGLDPKTRQIKYEERYFLEIHALHKEFATAEDKVRVNKKSNDSEVQRNFSNGGNRIITRNNFSSSGRYTPPMIDKTSPQNDLLAHSFRLKKNTRQIVPISTAEPHIQRKHKREFSQEKNVLNEDDKVAHYFQKLDPSTRRITLARKPPTGLNSQKERDQVECEIRTLTDY